MEPTDLHTPSDHEAELQAADVDDAVAQLEREAGITDVIPPPPAGATIQDYQRAYTDAERNLFKMRTVVRQLQIRCGELEVRLNSTRRPRKAVPKDVQQHSMDITTLGRKYCVLITPWPNTPIEIISQRPAIDYHSEHRYVSDAANKQAARAELFDHIPPHMHKLMGYSAFADTFRVAIQTQRANVVHSARGIAHLLFPNVPADLLNLTKGRERLRHPEVCRLLGYNPTRKKYQALPPILYPSGQETHQSLVFRSPALLQLGRMILFRQSSLTQTATFRPHPNSTGKKWSIVEVSPGYIAFVAIVLIYLLSPDANFQERGAESQIAYHALFDRYKKVIISSIQGSRGRSLFKLWNEYVFGSATPITTDNSPNERAELDDEFDGVLNALQNDSDDSEEDTLAYDQGNTLNNNNNNNNNDRDNVTHNALDTNGMRGEIDPSGPSLDNANCEGHVKTSLPRELEMPRRNRERERRTRRSGNARRRQTMFRP
ncbi:hypothetical protein QCA50_014547 [Cerrena zonata]|uniref:Uncharacterized protein n=1 Tax=Cerrena zonata TaxID=2478898 RepID=A0AAW0FQH5_9APHY